MFNGQKCLQFGKTDFQSKTQIWFRPNVILKLCGNFQVCRIQTLFSTDTHNIFISVKAVI